MSDVESTVGGTTIGLDRPCGTCSHRLGDHYVQFDGETGCASLLFPNDYEYYPCSCPGGDDPSSLASSGPDDAARARPRGLGAYIRELGARVHALEFDQRVLIQTARDAERERDDLRAALTEVNDECDEALDGRGIGNLARSLEFCLNRSFRALCPRTPEGG